MNIPDELLEQLERQKDKCRALIGNKTLYKKELASLRRIIKKCDAYYERHDPDELITAEDDHLVKAANARKRAALASLRNSRTATLERPGYSFV